MGFSTKAINCRSFDEVVQIVLCKIWPFHEEVCSFQRANNLRAFLDCYVEYRVDRPLINLEPDSLKKMASLECSFGLEVVRLGAAHDFV